MLDQLVKWKKATNEVKNYKSEQMLLEGATEALHAVLDNERQEFHLYTPNVHKIEENCFAKLYYNRSKQQFVLKSRYCLNCS